MIGISGQTLLRGEKCCSRTEFLAQTVETLRRKRVAGCWKVTVKLLDRLFVIRTAPKIFLRKHVWMKDERWRCDLMHGSARFVLTDAP